MLTNFSQNMEYPIILKSTQIDLKRIKMTQNDDDFGDIFRQSKLSIICSTIHIYMNMYAYIFTQRIYSILVLNLFQWVK